MGNDQRASPGRRMLIIGLGVALIGAIVLVWSGKGGAWLGPAPFLLFLLLCPLLHVFMHRGHGSAPVAREKRPGASGAPHRH